MKNIWNDPRSLFNGNHFSSYEPTLGYYVIHKPLPLWLRPRVSGFINLIQTSHLVYNYYIEKFVKFHGKYFLSGEKYEGPRQRLVLSTAQAEGKSQRVRVVFSVLCVNIK